MLFSTGMLAFLSCIAVLFLAPSSWPSTSGGLYAVVSEPGITMASPLQSAFAPGGARLVRGWGRSWCSRWDVAGATTIAPAGARMVRSWCTAGQEAHHLESTKTSRRELVLGAASVAAAVGSTAHAQASQPAALSASPLEKQRNLPANELAALVTADINDRQYLVTGDLTRSIYDESCTFQDEIDTYTLEKWVKGTSALFNGACSHVDIVGPVSADASEVRFKFSETLVFNIPALFPKVPLTGEVVLKRGADGLITSYKEIWGQGVSEVLSKAKLFGCG